MVEGKYARQQAYRDRRRDRINTRLGEADRMELALREIAFWVSESKKEMGLKLRALTTAALSGIADPLHWEPPANIKIKGE